MVEQAYLFHSLDWSWEIAGADAVVTQLVLALGGYIMHTSFRYYRPGQKNAAYIVIWSIVMAGLLFLLQRWLLSELFPGRPDYLLFLSQSSMMRYMFNWLMIAFVSVLSWIWYFLHEQREHEKRKQDAEQLARTAELTSLRQQLQPHFLFNSLNSISALAGSRPEEARKMIQQLSDFLRGTLKKDDRQMVTLEEELFHLQLYLDIEKVRFGYRLQTHIVHDDFAVKMTLPALLLQPVVENAIKFGLYDTTGEIMISIDARAENKTLVLNITNPFDAVTSSSQSGTGFGLSSIQRRLYLLFFRNDLLTTHIDENRFTTTIKIPQQ
ncbi:MAG: sensor histidine kinase [Azospira oryzae]|nr:sensor histidine kinase [Cytophaga sp.]PZR40650.1 MAG: sensor histidine kinase [Azospira oryzae]